MAVRLLYLARMRELADDLLERLAGSTAVLASPNATAAETSWIRTFVGPNAVQ